MDALLDWSSTFTVNPFNLFTSECATYTLEELVTPGYESRVRQGPANSHAYASCSTFLKLSLYLNTERADHMIVFANQANQSLLVPTSMYGRYFIKLPKLEPTQSGYIQYQIRVTERHSLPTEKLPCHDDDEVGTIYCNTTITSAN